MAVTQVRVVLRLWSLRQTLHTHLDVRGTLCSPKGSSVSHPPFPAACWSHSIFISGLGLTCSGSTLVYTIAALYFRTLVFLRFSLRLIGSRWFGTLTGLIFSIVVIACFLPLLDYDYLWDADRLEFCFSFIAAACVCFVRRIRRRFSPLSNFGIGVSKMRAKCK